MTRPRTGFPFLDEGLDQASSVLAFAHRGGAFHPELEGLENTLAAFQHAVDLGYRYLETDVHATVEGTLLALHDSALDRVTDRRGPVSSLRVEELRDVLVGGREQIPRLSGLLETFPEARFNIDLKSAAAVRPLADLVAATGCHDRVCVGSFSHRWTRWFRRLAGPRVATAASPTEVATVRLLPSARLLASVVRSPAALQVPRYHGPVEVVTPALVTRAHALGKHVHVWTVNDPAQMHQLLDMGVDGLITDRTELLREVLLERGQWMVAR